MIYSVKNLQELTDILATEKNGVTINIDADMVVSRAIEIANCRDIKLMSQKGCKLMGGIIPEQWKKEGKFVVFETETEPRVLIINGKLRQKSAFPESGYLEYLNITERKWQDSRNGGWDRQPTNDELTHITVKPEDFPQELDVENCDMRAIHVWDESTVKIKEYNKENGEIVTEYPMGHPAGAFGIQKYKLLNTKYGLTQKGTWCYVRKEKKIYYYPFDGENAENCKVMIPVSNSVIRIKNCENVTIENLKIMLSNSESGKIAGLRAINPLGAVQVENSTGVNLNMLEISFSGGQGIKCLKSKDVTIQNSVITQCASGGIFTHECENERIAYNHIENIRAVHTSFIGRKKMPNKKRGI